MKKLIALLVILFTGTQIAYAAGTNAVIFRPDPMVSFAHFLMGISKVMPAGSSFSPEVFAYFRSDRFKAGKEQRHIDNVAGFLRAAADKCASLHDFELKVYHTALGKRRVFEYYRELLRALKAEDQKAFRSSFLYLYRAFQQSLSGFDYAVSNMMDNIESTSEYKVFAGNLNQMRAFLAPDDSIREIRVVPVFLNVATSDIPALRELGITGTFGLNLDQIQLIELPLIEGKPVATLMGLSHMYAVTLHEICHYYYYRSGLCGNLVRAHTGDDGRKRHLLAETLATALGNGLYFKALGNEDPQWYADPSINEAAHGIFPLLQTEIERGGVIDDSCMKGIAEIVSSITGEAQ